MGPKWPFTTDLVIIRETVTRSVTSYETRIDRLSMLADIAAAASAYAAPTGTPLPIPDRLRWSVTVRSPAVLTGDLPSEQGYLSSGSVEAANSRKKPDRKLRQLLDLSAVRDVHTP